MLYPTELRGQPSSIFRACIVPSRAPLSAPGSPIQTRLTPSEFQQGVHRDICQSLAPLEHGNFTHEHGPYKDSPQSLD